MKLGSVLLVLSSVFSAGGAHAQTQGPDTVAIDRPWARATPAGAKVGVAYLTLANRGSSSDVLVGASTPVAEQVQFHEVIEDSGVSRMRQMSSVEIGAGTEISFKPGGLHIMIVGIKEPLKEGQAISMTFTFKVAGKVDVMVPIAKVGAMQGPATDSSAGRAGEPPER